MKKTHLTLGAFTLLSLGIFAQGPSEISLTQETPAAKQATSSEHYSIQKLDLNSDSHADFGGYMQGDQFYFLSTRKSWAIHFRNEARQNFLDLYTADMSDDAPKAKFVHSKTNRRLNEGPICFSKDGSRVYYTRDYKYGKKSIGQNGKINLGLYTANVEDGKWKNEQALSINNIDFSVSHPALSNDGKTLYFVSNQAGGNGGTDIYQAAVGADGNVSSPKLIEGDVNTSGNEMFPSIGANDELYYSSTSHESTGGLDIFIAMAKGNGFANSTNVGAPVNSTHDDFAYMPSSVNKGYFSSNRDGTDDVFSYNQLVPFRFAPSTNGAIAMSDNSDASGVKVELLDENGNVLDTQMTDANGNYSFDLEDGKEYTIRYSKDDFISKEVPISTKGDTADLSNEISLEKDNGIDIFLLITESGVPTPIEGVKVELTDITTGKSILDGPTGKDGMVHTTMKGLDANDLMHLDIKLSKEGFLTKEISFKHVLENLDDIPLHKYLQDQLKMDKIDIGKDVGQMIDIKPIYFDLGKYSIREDAAVELEKMVQVLKNNPSIEIELGSHTDARGSSGSNLSLSSKRAKASADYIVSKGISASRISGKGYGESKLINKCKNGVKCSEAEHEKNRRTEFVIKKI